MSLSARTDMQVGRFTGLFTGLFTEMLNGRQATVRALRLTVPAVLVLLLLATTALADKESDRVDGLLNRLGLARLQIAHLEQVVRYEKSEDIENVQIAKKLADLYATELMQRTDEPERYAALFTRVKELLVRIPAARTDSLDAMLLQADYRRVESLATDYLAHRDKTAVKTEATASLFELAGKLSVRHAAMSKRVQELDKKIDETDVEAELDLLDAEYLSLLPIVAQTGFFAGWAKYYSAVLSGNNKASLEEARQHFSELLDLEGTSYGEIEASWLALESPWRARAWIGLALTEVADGKAADGATCFELLRNSAAPATIRELTDYWHVQAHINASQWKAATEVGRKVVANVGEGATQGQVSVCLALVRGAYSGPRPESREDLAEVGVVGLVSMRQWSIVQDVLAEYEVTIGADRKGFAWGWLRGHQLRTQADGNRAPATFQAARDSFLSALSSDGAKRDFGAASQCRAELAWCQFQLGEFEAAAENYGLATSGLERTAPKAAEQAAWMRFVCFEKLAKSQVRFAAEMQKAADLINEKFPQSEYTEKAAYAIRRLTSNRDPAMAIVELGKIPRTSADYLSAQRDICQLRYNLWKSARDVTKKTALAAATKEDWLRYKTVAGGETETNRLQVGLWVLEVAIGSSAEVDFRASLTRELNPLAEKSPGLAANFHYVALADATARGATADRDRHIEWLMSNGRGTRFELAALLAAAKRADSNAQANPDKRELLEQAHVAYGRLSTSLGDTEAKLRADKNARVAVSRLAAFAGQLGKFEEAADLTTRLAEAQPKSRYVLRQACQANILAGRYSVALPMARTLLRGEKAGTDGWYEAKLAQIQCLQKVDRGTGKTVWKQFLVLSPDMGGEKWKTKFKAAGSGY
jgi:hypothetical protein